MTLLSISAWKKNKAAHRRVQCAAAVRVISENPFCLHVIFKSIQYFNLCLSAAHETPAVTGFRARVRYIFLCLLHWPLFGLLMLQRLSLWDTGNMLTKQTGWCYMMSPREHVECSTGLIYIGLAPRQRGLFIKTTLTALLGLVAGCTRCTPHNPASSSPPPLKPRRDI